MKRILAILVAVLLCVTLCGGACADDSWTIFVYLCGADLESEGSLATDNMQEMIAAAAASTASALMSFPTMTASLWGISTTPSAAFRELCRAVLTLSALTPV